MLFPNENTTDEAFSTTQAVDAALSKIAELSRKLRFARNSLTPINKLPVELLSEIFLYLQTPDHAVFVPISFREWYQVLHVCRHWRDVAHNSPLLWTKVDICAHPGLLEEMLGKSRNASLEVKIHLSRPSSRTVRNWMAVVQHVRRMRILNITADASTCYTLLHHAMIDVEVPRLEALRIVSSDRSESLELPLGLFSKGAPRLQRLEFVGCTLPWDAPLLVRCPELKTLILRDLQMVPSIEPFLHVLQEMPLLEVLEIAQCLPPLLSPPTLVPLHLRHLRQLLLHDTPAGALALLKSIQMPRRFSATISCEAFDMIDKVSALSSLFHTTFEMNGTNGFRDLYLDTSTLTCRMRTTRDGSPRTLLEYPVNVALDGPVSFQRLIDVVVPLPLIGNMTSMSLDGKRVMGDRSALRTLLHAAPNIQTLHVYHKTAMTVLAVLCADASADNVDPEATADAGGTKTISLLLPRLEHLILEDVAMNWVWEHADVLNQLQETQFLRSIRGRPISELTVTACRQLTAEEIRVLCHLFVDVHWDGYSGVDDDGDGESGAEEGRDEAEDDPELWEMWEGNAVGWHS